MPMTPGITLRERQTYCCLLSTSLFSSLQDLLRGETGEAEASLGQQITPARLRTPVVYEEVYPGVDFQYERYSYHIKETIVV